jgi:hypothetical protein
MERATIELVLLIRRYRSYCFMESPKTACFEVDNSRYDKVIGTADVGAADKIKAAEFRSPGQGWVALQFRLTVCPQRAGM